MKHLLFALTALLALGLQSCKEDSGETDEYANWQSRNEAYFATLADSMRAQPNAWRRIKTYTKSPDTEGVAADYIYAKVMASGEETESPMISDSVRVVYQGHLISTTDKSDRGPVFDGTVYGPFSVATGSTAKQKVSSLIDGYATALLHMHRGDHWRIYIPSELAYGSAGSGTTIPAYSVCVFDLALIDFSPAGQVMRPWN